jgi:hypothetical protein
MYNNLGQLWFLSVAAYPFNDRSTFVTKIRMQKILVILQLYLNPITLVLIWKVLRQAIRWYHYFWNPSTFGRVISLFEICTKYLQSLKGFIATFTVCHYVNKTTQMECQHWKINSHLTRDFNENERHKHAMRLSPLFKSSEKCQLGNSPTCRRKNCKKMLKIMIKTQQTQNLNDRITLSQNSNLQLDFRLVELVCFLIKTLGDITYVAEWLMAVWWRFETTLTVLIRGLARRVCKKLARIW